VVVFGFVFIGFFYVLLFDHTDSTTLKLGYLAFLATAIGIGYNVFKTK